MEIHRRQVILSGGAAALTSLIMAKPTMAEGAGSKQTTAKAPWHQRIKRITQINFTEEDVASIDAAKVADYAAQTHAEAVLLSLTGAVAFYPTKLPNLRRAIGLGDRDIVGECTAALKARGIKVIGRMSPDVASLSEAHDHPEWFRRPTEDAQIVPFSYPGVPLNPSEDIGFAYTCQFTVYFSDIVPSIIRECMDRYELDGIYMNGWPNTNVPVCHCQSCQKVGDPASQAYKDAYVEKAASLWNDYYEIVRGIRSDAIFTGNITGGIEGGDIDHSRLTAQAPWFSADNQGRKTTGPAWDAAQQVRMGRAIVKGRPVLQATAAYAMNYMTRWRLTAGNPAEVASRLIQTAAAGGTLWFHWLGYQGLERDRRWQQTGIDFLSWQARHDRHFHNRRSLARVGIVVSPRSSRLYNPPPGTTRLDAIEGSYLALSHARIPFDLLHEDHLELERLKQYQVLLLPNVAVLSELQVRQIEAFAAQGGSVVATFETGTRESDGGERKSLALGDLFGASLAGPRLGASFPTDDRPDPGEMPRTYERSFAHPVTEGFGDTRWTSGASWHVQAKLDGRAKAVMQMVPDFPSYPVEAVYPRTTGGELPAAIVRQRAKSRHVFLPGDVDGTYWRFGVVDHATLLVNSVRWALGDAANLTIEGDGLLDTFMYRTDVGYALHLVNYSNPHLFRGGFRAPSVKLGIQTISLTLDEDRLVTRASLLRAEAGIEFQQRGRNIFLSIPSIEDYEVVALEL